jgi:hypothetical protein
MLLLLRILKIENLIYLHVLLVVLNKLSMTILLEVSKFRIARMKNPRLQVQWLILIRTIGTARILNV